MGYYSERTCPECLSIPCTWYCGVECECSDGNEGIDHDECTDDECECRLHGDGE